MFHPHRYPELTQEILVAFECASEGLVGLLVVPGNRVSNFVGRHRPFDAEQEGQQVEHTFNDSVHSGDQITPKLLGEIAGGVARGVARSPMSESNTATSRVSGIGFLEARYQLVDPFVHRPERVLAQDGPLSVVI